jgi:hypothetical protein
MILNQIRMETQNSSFVPITTTSENMFSYIIKQKNKNVIILSSDEESDSESTKVRVPSPRPLKVQKLKGSKNDPIPLDDSDEEMQDAGMDSHELQLAPPTQDQKDVQLPPSTTDTIKEEDKHRDLSDQLTEYKSIAIEEEKSNQQMDQSKDQVHEEPDLPNDLDEIDAMQTSDHSPAIYSPLSDFATLSDIAENDFSVVQSLVSDHLEETMELDIDSSEAMIIVSDA